LLSDEQKRSTKVVLLIVEQVNVMLATRNKLIELGQDYYTANGVMPVRRLFHRSREGRFTVRELDSLRGELKQEMAAQLACPDADNLGRAILDLRARLDNINRQGPQELAAKAQHGPALDPESSGDDASS
jgi:hypothetical protein